jgi:hypothetical protein
MVGEGDFKAFTDMLEGEELSPDYKNVAFVSQLNPVSFGAV